MNLLNKKVILTGGTGLIGQEILKPLMDSGYEIFALSRSYENSNGDVNWVNCDIFDYNALKQTFEKIKASYLIHLAWIGKDDYMVSELNLNFLSASINMLRLFKENKGQRLLTAGTCFEYKFKEKALKENDLLDSNKCIYAFCKNKLYEVSKYYCEKNDISFAHGRIFYAYGQNEIESRLTGMIIKNLLNNQCVNINHSSLLKDFVYTKDIANAFVSVLNSSYEGAINIASSVPTSVGDFAKIIARELGKEDLLNLNDFSTVQPPVILGDNRKLTRDVGYEIKYSVKDGLSEIVNDILSKL